MIMSIRANFNHSFQVNASLSRVADFHQRSASMAAITPPPIRVQMHQCPEILADGNVIEFTLWLGILPIHWKARIEGLSESGFSDRQLKGPFSDWVHLHSFARVHENKTEIKDQIALQFRPHLFWGLVGLGFYIGLPVLFKYRAWKTRRLLEKGSG